MQEPRNAAIPLDLDDDTVSVQSQETEKQPETPASTLSKSSNDSKESTPQPAEGEKKVEEVKKETPEPEKKVKFEQFFNSKLSNSFSFKIIKREKGPAPLPPPLAAAMQIRETSPSNQERTPSPSPAVKVPNSLKIIEDDEEEPKQKSPTSPEIIPPPPPEFANEKVLDESSEIKVQFRSSGGSGQRVAIHQDIRRSFSVDSPTSTTLANNNKLNTSMITINDTSNSLATNNMNQVTVVTTHPPVIIDNSSEVVIVSNETNKSQQVQESSTDDDYQSYDSLESSPKLKSLKKLDESEVLIVSPFEDEELRNYNEEKGLDRLDTSHVSVVTVGDEVKVKDSSHLLADSNSDLSHADSNDGIEFTKSNGQILYNSKRSSSSRDEDVNIIVRGETKKRISPDSSVDCSSTTTGDSPTRENGSAKAAITSNNGKHDRSDAESISTTASHDSDLEGVQLRRKEPEMVIVQPPSPKRPTRTKEEIQIANLKKKTRKRTRRFEIDGVQVTTTTSKVRFAASTITFANLTIFSGDLWR